MPPKTVSCQISGLTTSNAFFRILSGMKPIARRWVVTLPETDGFEFSGAVNQGESCVPGIDSVFLNVYEQSESQALVDRLKRDSRPTVAKNQINN